MKRNKVPVGILLFLFAFILFAGKKNAYADETDNRIDPHMEESTSFGGGYAASNQIPGVYYLPVLYDSTNGLPTSEANCILCSSDGYIWIGGYSGVFRYDGIRFDKLPVEEGFTSGRDIFEDSKGRIWVGTNDKGVTVIEDEKILRYTKADGLASNSIRTFAEDAKGNVFIGTTAGVSYVDVYGNLKKVGDSRINKARIQRLVADVKGNIYGQTGSGDVFEVTAEGIKRFYMSREIGISKITTILADPYEDGVLYFGTDESAVYHGRFGDTAPALEKIETGAADNIHWMHYACDRLWVASVKLAGYIDQNNTFVPFEKVPVKDAFEKMTSDYQGNIWFASSRYGVMKLVADNFLDITGAAGMPYEVINTTCKRGTDLYVGTDDGLRIIDKDYHEIENEVTEYFKGIRIRCIINDSRGNTWFAAYTGNMGLVRLDPEGELTRINVHKVLHSYELRCIYELSDGTIAVGSNGGIAIVDGDIIRKAYNSANGMDNTVVLTVCEGANGEILAGTDGDGIYVLKEGNVSRIGVETGLGSDVIMRLKKDEKRDLIWVITSSSVEYLKDGEIKEVTTFPYNNCFDVVISDDDDLWFLSSQGIYCVSAEDAVNDNITNYKLLNTACGLTSIPISHCYSGIDADSNLYVAGQTGVSVVNVNGFKVFSGIPRIDLGYISYEGEEILPKVDGSYFIPEGEGRLLIIPAVLDYTVSDPLIKLYFDGLDNDAIIAHQSEVYSLEYTRFPYGDYVFHIDVLDSRTKKVITGKEYRLVKTPGFFERRSVRLVILVVLLVAIGIAVWRFLTGTVIKRQYSQIQEARDEAERANSAKSRFLANMSHEIRTPINTIMGMDEMILREDTGSAPREYYGPVTSYARNIKYASESLLSLINDLLDISKIESGKMHLVEQEYDTVELLRGLTTMIRGRAEDRKLYFDLNIDETLPKRLYGDGGKIKQIVLNLLTNAVKYTDEGGFVLSVKVTERNEAGVSLEISVKDTGIGVKPEDQDKLFSAYERLDEVKNSAIQGTGLGLDISRQFAELMGGKLWCESVYGEGSEFILTLKQKIVDPAGIGVFLEESAEESKGGYKPLFIAPDADILIVDDNPMNLNVIKGLLKPTKVFVTTASSGEECLEKIASNNFNVVLLDHMMPGMDGIETLAKIRVDHPDLPVYALTANSSSGADFYKSAGFDGYLTKPIDVVAVERAIMQHLPENIMDKPAEEDTVEEENTLNEDLRWVENAEGISAEDGIRNSGGASQYAFTLNMFYDLIDDNANVIEKAYEDNDIKLATVKVHALKTSARIIGALKLSEDCLALEEAGKQKDMAYIEAHKDQVLADYRRYKETLKPIKGEAAASETISGASEKEAIEDDILKESYEAIKDCAADRDAESIGEIVSELRDYKLSQSDEERIKQIEDCLKDPDWDRLNEVLKDV